MTKKLFIIATCALMILSACCKKEQEPETPQQEQGQGGGGGGQVDPPQSLSGNVARPNWTAPTDGEIISSMTAVIRVDLLAQYPNAAKDFVLTGDDLMAAFSGEKCLGVSSPEDGIFYLYIAGTEGAVTLRYWSGHYKNLFVATDAFVFKNDDHLGTVTAPLTPAFLVAQ